MDGMLSQEEINALLNGMGGDDPVDFVLVQIHHAEVFIILFVVVIVPAGFALTYIHNHASQVQKRKMPFSKTRQLWLPSLGMETLPGFRQRMPLTVLSSLTWV